jgi:hypothetical protein
MLQALRDNGSPEQVLGRKYILEFDKHRIERRKGGFLHNAISKPSKKCDFRKNILYDPVLVLTIRQRDWIYGSFTVILIVIRLVLEILLK